MYAPLSICGTPVQTLYLLQLYLLWPGVICGRIRKRAMAPEQLAAKAEAERLEAEAEVYLLWLYLL